MIVVACMQGQPLFGRAVCTRRESCAFDTFMPFPSFCLLRLVGTNVQGRQWVMGRVRDEKSEQSKAFAVSIREGQVQNEGIKEE